jgi:hypothetical protein
MIFRATVFFVPLVVVVFWTLSVTVTVPHRSASAPAPATVFVTRLTVFTLAVVVAARASAAPSSATSASIAVQTNAVIVFLMGSPGWSESESLNVDVFAWNIGLVQVALDRSRHGRRAAEEDLAVGDVGNERAQVLGREEVAAFVGRVVAGDDVQLELA